MIGGIYSGCAITTPEQFSSSCTHVPLSSKVLRPYSHNAMIFPLDGCSFKNVSLLLRNLNHFVFQQFPS